MIKYAGLYLPAQMNQVKKSISLGLLGLFLIISFSSYFTIPAETNVSEEPAHLFLSAASGHSADYIVRTYCDAEEVETRNSGGIVLQNVVQQLFCFTSVKISARAKSFHSKIAAHRLFLFHQVLLI